jgi:hypothetical protein
MYEALKLTRMIKSLEKAFEKFSEHRREKIASTNWQMQAWGHFRCFSPKARHFWRTNET